MSNDRTSSRAEICINWIKTAKSKEINAQCMEVAALFACRADFRRSDSKWKGREGFVAAFNCLSVVCPKSSLCPQKAGIEYPPNQTSNYRLLLSRYSLEIAERSDSGNDKHWTEHESLSLSTFISEIMQVGLTESGRMEGFLRKRCHLRLKLSSMSALRRFHLATASLMDLPQSSLGSNCRRPQKQINKKLS